MSPIALDMYFDVCLLVKEVYFRKYEFFGTEILRVNRNFKESTQKPNCAQTHGQGDFFLLWKISKFVAKNQFLADF